MPDLDEKHLKVETRLQESAQGPNQLRVKMPRQKIQITSTLHNCITIWWWTDCTCQDNFLNLISLDQEITCRASFLIFSCMNHYHMSYNNCFLGTSVRHTKSRLAIWLVITRWRCLLFSHQLVKALLEESLPEFLSTSRLLLLSPVFHRWSLLPCLTYFVVNLPADMPWCKLVKDLRNIILRGRQNRSGCKFNGSIWYW